MPGAADFVQRAVHALEAGGLAVWIKRVLVVVVLFFLAGFYLWHFRGLATSDAMDQAQVARHIVNGRGWSTSVARPLAIEVLRSHGKNVASQIWVDTYNAPLPPLVNAIAMLTVKSRLTMSSTALIFAGDKAIAVTAVIFFFLSVIVLYFIARQLFDQRLATYACALVLLCDTIWQYSMSGLPQMLLLFLFNSTLYFLVRAVRARYEAEPTPIIPWLAAAGLGFGLLALSHALTIWIFVAALIFSVFYFRPRGIAAGVLLAAFAVVYVPWMIRTIIVSGSPAGMAWYALFDNVTRSEAGWMRHLSFDSDAVGFGAFRVKLSGNVISQLGRIFEYLGWNVVAMSFFVALLHPFKRPETSGIRWLVLSMWGGAAIGMIVYGLSEEQGFAANQLHLLFVPIMICYGFAFLMVQWSRLELTFPFARAAFIALLFVLCAFPMLNTMVFSPRKPLLMWPPYVPPYIAVMHWWMQPNELIASDMPWAVAWYADRRSVWVPDTVKNLTELTDYKTLGGPISALYLTLISGSNNKYGDILKGEYKDWSGIIQHTANLEKFTLKYPTLALGVNEECVFISDTDRTKIKPQ